MSRRARSTLVALVLACGVANQPRQAFATDLPHILTGYTNTAWSQKDGLPSGTVYALAQDDEGYLWVGTNSGVYRFDGVRFISWNSLGDAPLPHRAVRALLSAPGGGIWVGFAEGGVSRIQGARLEAFDERTGLAPGGINALVLDTSGVVWAATAEGLSSYAESHWQRWSEQAGLPAGAVTAAYVSRDGRLVVGGANGIFQRAPGASAFERIEEPRQEAPRSLAEDADGRLTIGDPLVLYRQLDETSARRVSTENRGRGRRLLFDRRGNLWVGTAGQGLWRIRRGAPDEPVLTEHTNALAGLLADGVPSLLEDRDGNIWAGTTEGLNRLTPHRVTQITDLGLVAGVDNAPDGGMWVGTVDAVARFSSHGSDDVLARTPLSNNPLRAIHVGEDGTVWVATDRFVGRMTKNGLVRIPGDEGLRHVEAITSDARGSLWISDTDRRLVRWAHGRQESVALPAGLERTAIATLFTDRSARVWIAFANGQLAAISADRTIRTFGKKDGYEAGICHAIYEDSHGVLWLAGTEGLSRFSDGHFLTVHRGNGFPTDNLTAVVEDELDNLWVGTGSGIVRLARGEFDKAIADPSYRVRYDLYDRSDGLAGLPFIYSSSRRAAKAGDGRLWFVTGRGLTIIDPVALQDAPPPAPVRIEGVLADDKRVDMSTGITLPPRTSRIEIDYTAPNLTSSLKTRFRYQLEGFDQSWIDADGRRQVYYTNLPPKTYRFRVMASPVNGGTWDEPGEVVEFSIRPMFYQASWFYALSAATLGLAIWSAWAWRIRQVRRQFSLLIGERARLSRAIHDTLLQSLTGVALGFDAIASDIEPHNPKATARLVRMRKEVEGYIREARQSIWDLRSPKLERDDLVTALKQACEHTVDSRGVALDFVVNGTPHSSSPKIEEQVLRIGQEAVTNAVRHAEPARVRVELTYGERELMLLVRDDGHGFDPSSEPVDHYGLLSMRERTEDVGGTFHITSQPGRGTDVLAAFPLPEYP